MRSFTTTTQTNPKETVNAVTTRIEEVIETKFGENSKGKRVENEKKEETIKVDPMSVILQVTIENIKFDKALVDLGSSTNLLPLAILKNIGEFDL